MRQAAPSLYAIPLKDLARDSWPEITQAIKAQAKAGRFLAGAYISPGHTDTHYDTLEHLLNKHRQQYDQKLFERATLIIWSEGKSERKPVIAGRFTAEAYNDRLYFVGRFSEQTTVKLDLSALEKILANYKD